MGRQKEGSFRLHTILLEHDAELRWGGGGLCFKKVVKFVEFYSRTYRKTTKIVSKQVSMSRIWILVRN